MLRKDAVLIDRNLTFQGSIFSVKNFPAEVKNFKKTQPGGVFFSGVCIWLGMTFNYPVLWVRVKGQGYGFG